MDNLEGLLSSINDAVWSVDLATKRFLYVNERLAHICGKTFGEIKNDPKAWIKLIHPDDIAEVKKALAKITRDKITAVEHRIVTHHGVKWILNKQRLAYDSITKTETLVGIVTDITQRKEAELKLIESEKTYRYLFLNNPNPIFIYDLETLKFLAVNSAATTHYGYSEEEFLGMTILDIRPEEDIPKILEQIRKKTTPLTNSKYWRNLKKDQSIIYTNNSGHEIIYEGHRAEMVLVHDVTDEVKTREEIILSKNNLDALINTTNDFIWSVDKNYRFMYANKAFIKGFEKITQKEIKSGDCFFTKSEGFLRADWKENFDRALRGEFISFIDQTILNNDKVVVAEVRLHPIYGEKDEITGVGCFSRDITERVKKEAQIMDQNKRLREITSLTSHEIRGPVTSILGLINLFNHQDPTDPFNKSIIEHIKETAYQLDVVIHQIVDKAAEIIPENLPKDFVLQNRSNDESI